MTRHWPVLDAHSRTAVCLAPRSFPVCSLLCDVAECFKCADLPVSSAPSSTGVFDAHRSLYEPPVNGAKAIRDFAQPMQRLITSYTVSPRDVSDFVKSIPALLQSIDQPFDVTKVRRGLSKRLQNCLLQMSPDLLRHLLAGGKIPGVPKQSLDTVMSNYMRQMARAAALANQGVENDAVSKALLPLDELPIEFLQMLSEVVTCLLACYV